LHAFREIRAAVLRFFVSAAATAVHVRLLAVTPTLAFAVTLGI
jgi:hypothetical protein